MKYDIIVVGAGLGGLTAASRLAVLGYKVAVFEQHYKAGGYASNFNLDGYEFDVSLHGIPGLLEGGNLNRILRCCQVSDKIHPLKYKDAYTVRIHEEEIRIPNDIIEYKQMLLERFPEEESGIRHLFRDLGFFEEGFLKHMLGESSRSTKWHKDSLLYLRWSQKTCYEVLKGYVKNEEFIRLFTAFWPNFGLPPKKLSALTFFTTWVSYHYHGKYYIKGGAKRLTESFLEVMQENEAKIYFDSNVVRILDDGKKVCGIQVESGEIYYADWIISNVNPMSCLNLISPELLRQRVIRKIKRSVVGCSLIQLYIGLDCSAKDVGIVQEETFICCGHNHEDDYSMAMKHQFDESGYLLTNYSSMDSTLNLEDHGVLTMTYLNDYEFWNLRNEEYIMKKILVKNQMIERIIKDYPGLKGHIVIAELATPRTMERYTRNTFGAVYGYRQNVRQTGRHRLQRNIGIRGLSLVGAWVSPGGGYEGTITGAAIEAQKVHEVLKRMKSCHI